MNSSDEIQNKGVIANQTEKKGSTIEPKIEEEITSFNERVIASLSYISLMAIIPFYLKKESKFCRHHGKQGMTLAIIFFFIKPFMVLDIIDDAVSILQIVIFFFMGLAALSGKWSKFPFLYNTACQLEKSLVLQDKKSEFDQIKTS